MRAERAGVGSGVIFGANYGLRTLVLATGLGCQPAPSVGEEVAAKTRTPRGDASPQPPAATPAPPPEIATPVDPPSVADTTTKPVPIFGQSEADGARLAQDFCHHGGELFAPPTGKPYPDLDDWSYQPGDPLSSCDEVRAAVLGTWKTAEASATLTQLEVIVEDAQGNGPGAVARKQVVTIRGPGGVADHVVTLYGISSFEEASDGAMDFDLKSAVFRDLLGGTQPDFLIHREASEGGNFEADRCLNTTTTLRSVAICGDHPSAPGCIDIPIALNEGSVPWSDLSECDEEIASLDLTPRGYTLRYTLPAKGSFVAKWVSKRKMKTSTDGPPQFEGTWSLDELFGTTDEPHDELRTWSGSGTVLVP